MIKNTTYNHKLLDDTTITTKNCIENGFVSVSEKLPKKYVLVIAICEGLKKKINVWYTGLKWDGYKYNGQKVLFWRPTHLNGSLHDNV